MLIKLRFWYIIHDKQYHFKSVFDTETGAYVRTGILDEHGKDTGVNPFMASYPHLIDVGIMGHCIHGKTGLCAKAGIGCYQSGLIVEQPNMSVEDFRWIAEQSKGKCNQFALGGRGAPDQHEYFEELLNICRENVLVPNFTPSGKRVIDFGQNIAGYVEFTVGARAGETLHLRFGELMDKDGELTLKNIQCSNGKVTTPLQEVHYTAKNGENHYKTKFAIFGFRYVEVEGNINWSVEDFTAIAVYSDMEETLKFSCSHPLINKFVENTRWSAKNNHAEIPTDCPTRERHGWTGDAQIFATTAGYFFDCRPSFGRTFLRMKYN